MQSRRNVLLIVLLLMLASAISNSQTSSRSIPAAFRKIQGLAGRWAGKDEGGKRVQSEFVALASNTAMMETLSMPGGEEMVTLYSVDVDSIVLTHYCPTNNQPRMRATPSGSPTRQLTFVFESAGNLPDTRIGHEQRLLLQFIDEDHITERWTWRQFGKDTELVFRLSRLKGKQSNAQQK